MTMEKWIAAALLLAFYIFALVIVWKSSRALRKANDEYKAALDDFGSASSALCAAWLRDAQLKDSAAASAENDAYEFWREIDHGGKKGAGE